MQPKPGQSRSTGAKGPHLGVRLGMPLALMLAAIVVALVPYNARAADLPRRWLGPPPRCSAAAIEVFRPTASQEYRSLDLIGTSPKPNPCRPGATRRLGLTALFAALGLIGVVTFVSTRRKRPQEVAGAAMLL